MVNCEGAEPSAENCEADKPLLLNRSHAFESEAPAPWALLLKLPMASLLMAHSSGGGAGSVNVTTAGPVTLPEAAVRVTASATVLTTSTESVPSAAVLPLDGVGVAVALVAGNRERGHNRLAVLVGGGENHRVGGAVPSAAALLRTRPGNRCNVRLDILERCRRSAREFNRNALVDALRIGWQSTRVARGNGILDDFRHRREVFGIDGFGVDSNAFERVNRRRAHRGFARPSGDAGQGWPRMRVGELAPGGIAPHAVALVGRARRVEFGGSARS